ncbi:MAG: DNA repair protein RadA, partial [Firmicutes bacterium]|nr:DNA repair protein RadA [Bacillota bacterium]
AKKSKTVFVCQECGYESSKWMGQCVCGAWNSFVEEKVLPDIKEDTRRRTTTTEAKPSLLKKVGSLSYERVDTGIGELNRVLGGGMVKGSLTLISGEPGIGKSTIIIQAAANIASRGKTVLYVSGEESEEQIKLRADRVCKSISESLFVLAETNIENVEIVCENLNPDFLIVDSIQTMYSNQLDSAPGSISQVRQVGNQLMRLGKTRNIPIFIVAHVTKSGDLAGPKTVEHLVDCVLNFTGERDQELRVLRSYKNRFGTTSEIGAFMMEGSGLTEVTDISATFLENSEERTEGSVTTAIYEGSRPVMFEIQSLVTPASGMGFARRTSVGIDNTRLSMIIAVMEKKVGLPLGGQDIYVNVVGGIRPEGTGTDIAVALAIFSSFKRIAPSVRTLALGEVGLTGDLRPVRNAEKIVKEAARLGYEQIIMPRSNADKFKGSVDGCMIVGVKDIREAIRAYAK